MPNAREKKSGELTGVALGVCEYGGQVDSLFYFYFMHDTTAIQIVQAFGFCLRSRFTYLK